MALGRSARRGLRGALAVAVVAGGALAPACASAVAATSSQGAASPPGAAGAAQPVGTRLLSDRRTVSHWAYPASEAPVHAAPSPHSRRIGRLRLLTSDAQAELYLALASRLAADGSTWIRIELPARPNG